MAIGSLPSSTLAYADEVRPAAGASRAWRKFARNPAALVGAVILAIVVGAALAAPWIAPHDPAKQSLIRRFTPPVWAAGGNPTYLLGTDQVGRDILSRIIHGARISLLVGVLAVIVSVLVGVTLGLVSGFVGGRLDTVLMTIVDITWSFPQILLALAFVAALGPSLVTVTLVLGLTGWERYARVVRAEVLALREKDFVEAARALGIGAPRILLRHVLPNLASVILVQTSLLLSAAILVEASLSFLGLGTQPPTPSLGLMLAEGRNFLLLSPWSALFAGFAILLLSFGFNLLGDALRDTLDPRLRGQE